uniref:Uncharacterized protein n=1 Tax=Anguilla anguilla TaxID=7936 RepID=A0A0E9R6T3_ANGAN
MKGITQNGQFSPHTGSFRLPYNHYNDKEEVEKGEPGLE